MHELDTPTFRLAVAQFDQAAEAMELDHNLRERLKLPQRSLIVSCPFEWMTAGSRSISAIVFSTILPAAPQRAAFVIIRM